MHLLISAFSWSSIIPATLGSLADGSAISFPSVVIDPIVAKVGQQKALFSLYASVSSGMGRLVKDYMHQTVHTGVEDLQGFRDIGSMRDTQETALM